MTDKSLEQKFVNVFTTPNVPNPSPPLTEAKLHEWVNTKGDVVEKIKPEMTFDAYGRPKGCSVPRGMNPFSSPIDECMAKVDDLRDEMQQQEFAAIRQYHESITPSLPSSPLDILNVSLVNCSDPHLMALPKTLCVPSMFFFEIYKEDFRAAFLELIREVRMGLVAGLKKHPSYHFASIDITLTLGSLLEIVGKKIGIGEKAKLLKKLANLVSIGVNFELNVDYFGRVYIGLGAELSGGFIYSGKNGYLIDSKKVSFGLGGEVTISRIKRPEVNKAMDLLLRKNKKGDNEIQFMKDDIEGMLTGHEVYGTVNILGLFVKGWTYAIEHGKVSTDIGVDLHGLEFSLGGSVGGNFSWLISK